MFFLNVVNLFLIIGTPEVTIDKAPVVLGEFKPLHNAEILPEKTHVVAQFQGLKGLNEGIAHAQVVEIDFLGFGNLFAQISAVCAQAKDDKVLFKHINIVDDRLSIHLKCVGKIGVGDFAAHLQGQHAHQIEECCLFLDAAEGQHIFEQIVGYQLIKLLSSIYLVGVQYAGE